MARELYCGSAGGLSSESGQWRKQEWWDSANIRPSYGRVNLSSLRRSCWGLILKTEIKQHAPTGQYAKPPLHDGLRLISLRVYCVQTVSSFSGYAWACLANGNAWVRHLSHMINRSSNQDAKWTLLNFIIPVAICTCLSTHAIHSCIHMFYMSLP